MLNVPLLTALALAAALPAGAQVWTAVPLPTAAEGFVTDPVRADHLLLRQNVQIWYETFDAGANWSVLQEPSLPTGVWRTSFSIDSQGRVVAWLNRASFASPLAGPVHLVREGGAWQPMGPSLAAPSGGDVQGAGLARGTLDPDLLVHQAVLPDSFGGRWSMQISTDGGATFGSEIMGGGIFAVVEAQNGPYFLGSFTSFVPYPFTTVSRSVGLDAVDQSLFADADVQFGFTPRFPQDMWVLSAEDELWASDQTFSRSFDGGATWNVVDVLTGSDKAVGLTVHPTRPGCAVLRRFSQGLELTRDGGQSFESLGVPYQPLGFVEDGRVLYATFAGALYRTELFPAVGAVECSAQVNGSGAPASMTALGSASIGENGLAIAATDVTPHQFGYFIASTSPGFVPGAGGSFGDLCLSGHIGRYVNLLQNAGPYGQMYGAIDLAAMPTPTGPVAAQVGQTWRFQAWFRDGVGGVPGSNFSDAVAVTLVP